MPAWCSPTRQGPMDDHSEWIERNAVRIRLALADSKVRADVLALLAGTDDRRRQQRRLEAVRRELEAREFRWPLLEDDDAEP
jgi:hypothetical protein